MVGSKQCGLSERRQLCTRTSPSLLGEAGSRNRAASLQRGCLWNTFVTVGRVTAFIDVLCHAAANPMLRLAAGIIENGLDSVYRSIPAIDFCRDVLASRPEHLLVI